MMISVKTLKKEMDERTKKAKQNKFGMQYVKI